MEDNKLKKGDRVNIDTLARYCGYFVFNCDNHCNNGYGCSHPKNESGIDNSNCDKHFQCYTWSCPLSFEVNEESEEVQLLIDEEDFNK